MEKIKKNVLLLTTDLGYGGAERSFHKLAYSLAHKHNLYTCVFHCNSAGYKLPGHVLDLGTPPSKSVLKKLYYILYRIWKVRKIKKEKKIAVSISFLEGADYVNVLSRRKDSVILSVRGSKMHDKEIRGLVGLLRRHILIPILYRKANLVTVVSQDLLDEIVGLGIKKSKLVYIPNGYDVGRILQESKKSLPVEFEKIKEYRFLVIVARLHIQKNHIGLIKVFESYLQLDRSLKLVIVGEGDEFDKLEETCTSLHLRSFPSTSEIESAQVVFAGRQSNPFPFIVNSCALILTSEWEGFPNALAEAMIIGVPVISSDCPTGPKELIDPYDYPKKPRLGLLLPSLGKSPSKYLCQEWVSKIQSYLEQESRSSNAHKRQQRMNEFEEGVVMKKWAEVLELENQ